MKKALEIIGVITIIIVVMAFISTNDKFDSYDYTVDLPEEISESEVGDRFKVIGLDTVSNDSTNCVIIHLGFDNPQNQ